MYHKSRALTPGAQRGTPDRQLKGSTRTIDAEANGIPEDVKGSTLHNPRAHGPFAGGTAAEAQHHHRYHA